jgi:phage shock protein PspC (stress-responsive transcriptional regulator)
VGGPTGDPVSRRWYDRPLRRSHDNVLGGVIAGICETYGFDVRTTRIAVAIGAFVVPFLVPLYIAAWILLPAPHQAPKGLRDVLTDRRRLPLIVVISVVILASGIGSIGWGMGVSGIAWGAALVLMGALLWSATVDRRGEPVTPGTPAFPAPSGPAQPGPGGIVTSGEPAAVTTAGAATVTPAGAPTAVRRRRRIPLLSATVVLAGVAVAAAAAGEALGWWSVAVFPLVISVLAALAVASVASAVVNRAVGIGLLVVPLGVAIIGLAVAQPSFEGGVGDRTVRPVSVAAAAGPHRLALGELVLDLTGVPVGEVPSTVNAEVGMGRLEVRVPHDALVVGTTRVGMGQLVVDSVELAEGTRVHEDVRDAPDGTVGARFELHLEVGVGEIDIVRAPAAG